MGRISREAKYINGQYTALLERAKRVMVSKWVRKRYGDVELVGEIKKVVLNDEHNGKVRATVRWRGRPDEEEEDAAFLEDW